MSSISYRLLVVMFSLLAATRTIAQDALQKNPIYDGQSFSKVLNDLKSDDRRNRINALLTLSRSPVGSEAAEAVPFLVRMLNREEFGWDLGA